MTAEKDFASEWHTGFEHVAVHFTHLRMAWLLKHLPPRLVWAVYVGINGFITIGLLALLALVTGSPFVFPSLGPTAYLFFFSPLAEASSPRNTILGHAIGLICGYAAFAVTAGFGPTFAAHGEMHVPRVLAAALSLAAAGATTLIVALGIIFQPRELVVLEIAVVLLTAQAVVINRIAGIPYPLWSSHTPAWTRTVRMPYLTCLLVHSEVPLQSFGHLSPGCLRPRLCFNSCCTSTWRRPSSQGSWSSMRCSHLCRRAGRKRL